MIKIYMYDLKTGEYLGEKEPQLNPNGEPVLDVLGTTITKPQEPFSEGYCLIWTGKNWEISEDHRRKYNHFGVLIEDSGTPFWLKDDRWDSFPRYMDVPGPLPENAMLKRPKKPKEEEKKEKLYALKEHIQTIEQHANRYSQEISYAWMEKREPNPEDVDKFIQYRQEIVELRDKFRKLQAS